MVSSAETTQQPNELIVKAGYLADLNHSGVPYQEIAEGIDGLTVSVLDPTFMKQAREITQALDQLDIHMLDKPHDYLQLVRNAVKARSRSPETYEREHKFLVIKAESADSPAVEEFEQKIRAAKQEENERWRQREEERVAAERARLREERQPGLVRRMLGRAGMIHG